MKIKSAFTMMGFLGLFLASACKRSFTCACEGPYLPEEKKKVEIKAYTKRKAKANCREIELAHNQYTGMNVSCEIK